MKNQSHTARFSVRAFWLVLLCAVLALTAAAFVFLPRHTAKAELVGADLATEYAYGTRLTVPQATMVVDGKQLSTESIVNFPSGLSYRNTTVDLNEMGEYTVEYRAQDGGTQYREYKEFSVYRNLFDIEGGIGASASYTPSPLAPDTQGINVKLTSGSTFYYHRVIDLTELDGNSPFVSAFISPERQGEMDGYTLYFRLTDLYDPDNYVTFRCNGSRAGIQHGVTYILCGGSEQSLTGVEWGWGRVHVNNIYGYPVNCSFYAQAPSGTAPENDLLTLYFDNESMAAKGDLSGSMIVDLDDPTYFTDPFLGFTTGEVTLSIWADDFIKNSFGLEITSIAGHDLSSERLGDTEGPEITVDFGDYDQFPVGLAGFDYPLFNATAYDLYSGETDVTVKVYQNYYDEKKYDCYVENGVFKPEVPGTYTVEYSSVDNVGNPSTEIFDIDVLASAPAVEISVDEQALTKSGFVGARIPIEEASVSGGIGQTSVRVEVTDGQGNAVESDGTFFVPAAVGTYKVKYIASDFVNQQDPYEYTVSVTVSDKPVFESDPALPEVFFTDSEYTLPGLSSYTYAGGKREVPVTVSVEDAQGLRELGSERTVQFTIGSDSDEVTVIYTAKDGSAETNVSYTVKCIRAKNAEGRLELVNYFETEGFTASAGNDYTTFSADGNAESASLRFRNLLLDDNLDVNFRVDTAQNKFESVTIRLTDITGQTSVAAVLTAEGTSTRLRVGTMSMLMNLSFSDPLRSEYRFVFDQANARLTADGINYLPVLTTEDGSPFTGFEGHMAYLEIEIAGITGASALQIVSINSQEISNTPLDIVRPRIYIEGVYGGAHELGEEIMLNRVYAADVVDPNPSLTIRVTGPDGQALVSTDGETLDNVPVVYGQTIRLEKYGTYQVIYTSADASGRSERTVSYTISVIDDVAPVITPQANMKENYTLGETVVIPKITVTDNETAAENISVKKYVVLPTGRIAELPGNSFIASYAGKYTVRYVAYDEAGNQALYEISFMCA